MVYKYKPHNRFDAPFKPERCGASIARGSGWGFRQCSRKPWKDGWCKQHHPESEAKRQEERRERREARDQHRREYGPWTQLGRAREEIARLKARISIEFNAWNALACGFGACWGVLCAKALWGFLAAVLEILFRAAGMG